MKTRILRLLPLFCVAASLALAGPESYLPADGHFPVPGKISSWSGFLQKNAERRADFAAHEADDQNKIVFVGDSITEGWHMVQTDFRGLDVPVANRGIGGDTTPNLVYRLQDDILSLHPRALVILIGTNDLGENTSPGQIASNEKEMLARIRAEYPTIPIAWCLVMPRGDNQDYVARIHELNDRIKAFAATDPHVTICDTFTPLARADGTANPRYFVPDLLHLNSEGYGAWRHALLPILESWHLSAE